MNRLPIYVINFVSKKKQVFFFNPMDILIILCYIIDTVTVTITIIS